MIPAAPLAPATPLAVSTAIRSVLSLKRKSLIDIGPAAATNTPDPTSTTLSTASVTYALTDLIIERGKEELSATFFEKLKTQIQNNPELQIAFPKTTKFIGQIESYLYASYLSTLRQAFVDDINNIPFNVGAILRTSRIKNYLDKNPKLKDVWFVVPVMAVIGDLRNGGNLSTSIKALYPDDELKGVSQDYYNVLKLIVCLSESARDITGKNEWIDPGLLGGFLGDPTSAKLFFGLLYQETKFIDPNGTVVNNYISVANETDITNLIEHFENGFTDTRNVIKTINDATASGTPLNVQQVLNIITQPEQDLKTTLADIDALIPATANLSVQTDAIFETLPKLAEVINDFDQKHFASGIMNCLLIINNYIAADDNKIQPFLNDADLNNVQLTVGNLDASLQLAITKLGQYQTQYPDDNIKKYLKKLKNLAQGLASTVTASQLKDAQDLYKDIAGHQYNFDAMGIYQQLLKYGTLMAALSEAKTTADVTAALDAAILPVGSSSIKYYTACSFSLNSYIGAAYYNALYNSSAQTSKVQLNTVGVALPIGPNFSVSTRSPIVGAVSVFVSVVDLGAVASYRLNSAANATNQTLPDFTFQNLLAPGVFFVANRIAKSPLSIGFGAQRAPQLTSITNSTANVTTSPTWRYGALLTLDIPLFNLYSHALKRPLN